MAAKYIALAALTFASGCATRRSYSSVNKLADTDQCEAAAKRLKRLGDPSDDLSVGEKVAGSVASYALTATGYTTDVLVKVTGGVVVAVVVCSPVIVLDAAARSSGSSATERCIGELGVDLAQSINPGLGEKAYSGTADWRGDDVDYTPLSVAMRSVAQCYFARGGKADVKKAMLQMDAIGGVIYEGSTDDERKAVDVLKGDVGRAYAAHFDTQAEAPKKPAKKKQKAKGKLPPAATFRYIDLPIKKDSAAKLCANSKIRGRPLKIPTLEDLNVLPATSFGDMDTVWVDLDGEIYLARVDTKELLPDPETDPPLSTHSFCVVVK